MPVAVECNLVDLWHSVFFGYSFPGTSKACACCTSVFVGEDQVGVALFSAVADCEVVLPIFPFGKHIEHFDQTADHGDRSCLSVLGGFVDVDFFACKVNVGPLQS